MNQAQHIEVSLDRQTTQQIAVNCLRLKTSIDVVRWLSFQGCAFRGHDESFGLKNHGNFLEFLSLLALYDEKVEDVLKSAPQNTSYTSSTIQKEILQIYANRVRNVIREEIGDRKFSIIVSEARDMNAQFIVVRSHNKKEDVTVEHQYRVNIFFATIDTELQELKSMFNEHVVELLTLTTTLDPKEFFKLFDIDKIFILVNTFYLEDISHQEKKCLPYELKHYELDACKHPDLRKISTLSKLCKSLVERGNSVMYPFADRLIHLILTLPVSTTSSERAFSAMKIVKTRLRCKIEDDFLRSSLVVYIEK
ncbi:uncharacterized protein [Gossypium hirsutum]|uniref:Zinc finger MYM-type protein 1-like n=1 Tax=Gossypium hirsutum TaxID=3635 RepID=A0A1U8M2G4_GOSHI|nr:uncharacterized protein LOC107932381 [Gossypium hirsutum]